MITVPYFQYVVNKILTCMSNTILKNTPKYMEVLKKAFKLLKINTGFYQQYIKFCVIVDIEKGFIKHSKLVELTDSVSIMFQRF